MRTNNGAVLAQARSNLFGWTCEICIAGARVLAGGTLVLGVVYAPSWVGILTAWYLG